MNKEEILAMEAGSLLDQLIAENVMGWQMYHYDKDHKDNCYYMLVDENFEAVANDIPFTLKNGERKTEEEAWKDNKPWSTDISAAWEVLDKLKETHDHIGIYFSQCIGKEWTGSITDLSEQTDEEGDFDVKDISADAETAQLAICRLALLAVME